MSQTMDSRALLLLPPSEKVLHSALREFNLSMKR